MVFPKSGRISEKTGMGSEGGPWRAEAGPEKSLPNATGLLSLFFFSIYFFLFVSIYHDYLGRVIYTPAHDFFSAAAAAVRIPHAPFPYFLLCRRGFQFSFPLTVPSLVSLLLCFSRPRPWRSPFSPSHYVSRIHKHRGKPQRWTQR